MSLFTRLGRRLFLGRELRPAATQAYSAASRAGRQATWPRPLSSATVELATALPTLRAAARDLVRNNAHAAAAVRALAAAIAGTGMRPKATAVDADGVAALGLRRAAEEQWARFAERCDIEGRQDWYGQQRLLARAVVEGGEALRLWVPVEKGGRLYWRCRVVEGDWLDHGRTEDVRGGGRIVQGVEFDALGRRVAYWLHRAHPGDWGGMSGYAAERVPADMVDHVFDMWRPGQVRGVPWFSPVATVLRDVDDLAEAELVRKKLEACIAAVVTNSADDTMPARAIGAAVGGEAGEGAAMTTAGGHAVERLTPGMILQARPGWDVSFLAPPASEGLVEHMHDRLQAIAAGVGVPYVQMTGDLAEANYSSMRVGELQFNRLLDGWQADLMVVQTGRPAWRRVMAAAGASGDLPPRDIPARWLAPPRPWVDPRAEAIAAEIMLSRNLISPQDIIERNGTTMEEVLDEIVEFRAALVARGIAPANDARAGLRAGDGEDDENA